MIGLKECWMLNTTSGLSLDICWPIFLLTKHRYRNLLLLRDIFSCDELLQSKLAVSKSLLVDCLWPVTWQQSYAVKSPLGRNWRMDGQSIERLVILSTDAVHNPTLSGLLCTGQHYIILVVEIITGVFLFRKRDTLLSDVISRPCILLLDCMTI